MNSNPCLRVALALLATAATAHAQTVLSANPGPQNNGLSASGSAMFFDLQASSADLLVTEMVTASSTAAGLPFTIEVYVRNGTALGGPVSAGAGSSTAGWTSLGQASAVQGPTSAAESLPIDIPDITLIQGQLTGVAIRFVDTGSRYFGIGSPPLEVYSDANLTLTTGDSRGAPFTPAGSFFSSRALVGSLTYELASSGPVSYCTAGTSSNGCTATMSATANPSLTQAAPCSVTINAMEGQKAGIVFYGLAALPQPWCPAGGGSSFLCVKAPTQRTLTSNSGGTPSQCDGSITLDFDAFQLANPTAVGNPWSAGDKVYLQGWYRDPPSCKTTSLSDALELTWAP